MDDQAYISLYHELTQKAMDSLFEKFKVNPKMILTESDLKCWLFLELTNEIESQQNSTLSVHTEVTHYPRLPQDINKLFMRDLTILDSDKLELNDALWDTTATQGNNALHKGFMHDGPAMHFELKLIRQGQSENSNLTLDVSDIANLNNVNASNRAYTIVWGSKNERFDIKHLTTTLKDSFDDFNRAELIRNDLLRFYLFDTNTLRAYKLDDEKNLLEINKI
ncbi:hypothetical protein [Flavobacterium microcysteis]|uniref:Uncharacterized protein n=1 Tax=Flavobacterium microcysteis TaxID=2596891 RepID=A0A501Q1P9_9FLAO|nr:hypothetical protein [Flavobacterium microcysteis]TPD65916.1 hypothetical protein FJA49_17200 [Flavobacterium microcysteis]